jgi:hypothetical protein
LKKNLNPDPEKNEYPFGIYRPAPKKISFLRIEIFLGQVLRFSASQLQFGNLRASATEGCLERPSISPITESL